MGICHGWSPRRLHGGATAEDHHRHGRRWRPKIKFYPPTSRPWPGELWATTNPRVKFIGGRCNTQDAGRRLDRSHQDRPAATQRRHLAPSPSSIRSARRSSMVLDATFDYEVWNQPVYGYDYSYFNPKTKRPTRPCLTPRLPSPTSLRGQVQGYRAAGTTHRRRGNEPAVGGRDRTSHYSPDSQSRDAISARATCTRWSWTRRAIIGGGATERPPDFLWTSPAGTRATASNESTLTGTWVHDCASGRPGAAGDTNLGWAPLSASSSETLEQKLARRCKPAAPPHPPGHSPTLALDNFAAQRASGTAGGGRWHTESTYVFLLKTGEAEDSP